MSVRLSEEDRQALRDLIYSDPVEWIEENFYVSDPRNPDTGQELPPGPIKLHRIQKRILRAALTKVNGRFPYSTILYSTIKKSGKTRIAAAVGLWYAATHRYNEVYCLANDGKQSTDRILSAMKECVELNDTMRESFTTTKTGIVLDNGTKIEAIPCDPSGQAGANPGLTIWSEMWGFQEKHKEKLWGEMTIPPTRFGNAFRWVESYAGYRNESKVLYDLYTLGKDSGAPHPAFPDLPVYTNKPAGLFCYWDEGDAARRMPWQTEDYYAQESNILTPEEFDRLHRNQWVDSVDKAIPIEWWDACRGAVPPLQPKSEGGRIPLVMSIDAAVSYDCCACTLISRHPDPSRAPKETMIRAVRIWEPPRGGVIDLAETVEKTMYEWWRRYNVVEVAYDKYQLALMMQNARKNGIKVYQFNQSEERLVSDKMLFDMIITQRITHDGNAQLRQHVDNAASKKENERLRFVKPEEDQGNTGAGRKKRPIDGLVSVSMGNNRCLHLNLA